MFKSLHQFLNPHCQHCADERKELREEQKLLREEAKYCSSCETLAVENARLVRENERLLNALLEEPATKATERIDTRDLKPINLSRTPFVPSHVRREMLERESRHSAQLLRDAPKPTIDKDAELKDLEAELDDVRQSNQTSQSNT